ncbi:hypothetical protein TNCV_2365641 [Trichonephila clavipes]|nr:hypothetical protein TNCV_2365641 [Trichonephila clavipes]
MSSSPVPLKTHRVGKRFPLNQSRAQTSSRWCGVVVRRGRCQLRCGPRHLTMVHKQLNVAVIPISLACIKDDLALRFRNTLGSWKAINFFNHMSAGSRG